MKFFKSFLEAKSDKDKPKQEIKQSEEPTAALPEIFTEEKTLEILPEKEPPFDLSKNEIQVQPENLESKEEKSKIDFVFENPEIESYVRVNYPFSEHDGRELKPGHSLLFVVPDEFKKRIVRDVVLRHRKDSKYAVDIGPDRHDPNGAYSRVELQSVDDGKWIEWRDPKGYNPDKFAEPRSAGNPEEEVLHDWIATVGAINADAVRVTNVGKNSDYSVSSVHGMEVVFLS